MKLKTFKIFACFFLFSLFAGCSSLFDSKAENAAQTDSSSGELRISIVPSARYISSYSFDLSKEGWNWELVYDENASDSNGKSISTSSSSGTNTPSLSFSDGVLTASNIPKGTYTITIKGTLNDGGTSCSVTGSKSGVKIEQGGSAKENIFVGLVKTSAGSGGLSLTLESADSSNFFSKISDAVAKLTSHSTGTVYSTSGENPVISWNTANGYVLSADNGKVASGWYTLSVTLEGYSFVLSDTEIEIADGFVTEGTVYVSTVSSKAYYATNSESTGNGLSVSSRINLAALLDSLSANLPAAQSISIFVDGDPEIDLYALSKLESALADKQNEERTVIIYNASNSESMKIKVTYEVDAEYKRTYKGTVESISNALTLKGRTVDETDYKTVDVGQIDTSNASFTITLVDGAAINLTNTGADTYIINKLGINAVTADGTDNLSAYYGTPFITFSTSSVAVKMFDVNTGYSVSYKENDGSYAYYITYVAMKTGSNINLLLAEVTSNVAETTSLSFKPYTSTLSVAELEAKTTVTLSEDDSITPCYAWLDSDSSVVYYYAAGYTDSEGTRLILLNADSGSMFKECVFTEIDMSGFSSKSVTNMGSMFDGCSSLTSLDVSMFDTSNVKYMSVMFSGCSSLKSLDLSTFDTSNVSTMTFMFAGCSYLESLDVSMFDTSNVKYMSVMFSGCSSLKSLDLSTFDTPNVTEMNSMFNGCSYLESLDVSNFDTSSVTDMKFMFDGCSSLTTITAAPDADWTGVSSAVNMFYNCKSLVGGNGTKYDSTKVDAAYAHIDTVDNPGYFTAKSSSN